MIAEENKLRVIHHVIITDFRCRWLTRIGRSVVHLVTRRRQCAAPADLRVRKRFCFQHQG
jgi:hypothetical protein